MHTPTGEVLQPELFALPPAGPVANPAVRPPLPPSRRVDPDDRPPSPPRLRYAPVRRDWDDNLGTVKAVDIHADHVAAPVGRLVCGLEDPEAEWFADTDDEEFVRILSGEGLGRRLRGAKAAVNRMVRAWAA